MESYYYAQINEQSICHSVTQLSEQITANHLIAIDSYDIPLLGKIWNGTEWITPPEEN